MLIYVKNNGEETYKYFIQNLLIFLFSVPSQQFDQLKKLVDLKVGWAAFKVKHSKVYNTLKEEAHR